MATEVRVPTLGESVTEATVATWFKKPGDQVALDDMLCELETDKVTVEVPSPVAGTWQKSSPPRVQPSAPKRCWHKSTKAPRPRPAAESARRAAARAQTIAVMVPVLGESVTEATVSTWYQKARRYGGAGRNAL